MNKYINSIALLFVGMFGACFIPSCQQTPRPLVVNPIEDFGASYREELAQFKASYPAELAAYKAALIQEYAKLPETPPNFDILPQSLEPKIWKKLAAAGKLKALPAEERLSDCGCPHEVNVALWEEIASETDMSDSSENLARRKAICNLYNYELALDECSMPPSVKHYIPEHLNHAGIVFMPHPVKEYGMNGNTLYVRRETLPAAQLEIEDWRAKKLDSIYNCYRDSSIGWCEAHDALLAEYYRRLEKTK